MSLHKHINDEGHDVGTIKGKVELIIWLLGGGMAFGTGLLLLLAKFLLDRIG